MDVNTLHTDEIKPLALLSLVYDDSGWKIWMCLSCASFQISNTLPLETLSYSMSVCSSTAAERILPRWSSGIETAGRVIPIQ
eukprot:5363847-Ditylum_brightwellii.AAC.1